jgi:CRISPR system Cascade subunit CasA
MTFQFNLVNRRWIPCVRRNGEIVELGLRDTLAQAHELREISSASPLEAAALYRLLLAVLHRVFDGPASHNAWHALWEREDGFDAAQLDAYWERWRSRFDLFDPERPFYQAPDDRVDAKPPNKLILDVAFGNKATLFDHSTDAQGITLTPAQAARAVLAAQCFGLAGLSGLSQRFTDGTCARGVLFFVQGQTLFETLVLNMIRYPTEDDVMPHHEGDRPAWEMDDPFEPERSRPIGYLDYLTWQNRRILLMPEETPDGVVVREMTLAPALRMDSEIIDPMKHYRRHEKRGLLVQRFYEERALWRDSAALFKLRDEGYHPPRTFLWLSELVYEGLLDQSHTRRYTALGMANNQAKVDFYRSERMPLPMQYLIDINLVEHLDSVLTLAESVRSQIWGAARTLARFVLVPEADAEDGREPAPEGVAALMEQWAIERDYWVRLEIPFHQTMEQLPDDVANAMTAWRETARRAAWTALDRVAGNMEHNPRNLKAAVRARGQLAMGLKKALSEA